MTFESIGDKKRHAQLTLDIAGQPAITIAGEDDRLSGEAYAGQQRSIPLISPTSAPRRWSTSASRRRRRKAGRSRSSPKRLPTFPPTAQQKVSAPDAAGQAIDGDYMIYITASAAASIRTPTTASP